MPHLRISETLVHLRRAAEEARYPAKLHPDSRAYACLVVPNGSRDSGSFVKKLACSEWAGAKVCSSSNIKLSLL